MSQVQTHATEPQKKTVPARQLEQYPTRQPGQGPVPQVAPQAAYRRAQVNRNGLRPADLLALQRAVGNRKVQQMVMQSVGSSQLSQWTGKVIQRASYKTCPELLMMPGISDPVTGIEVQKAIIQHFTKIVGPSVKYRFPDASAASYRASDDPQREKREIIGGPKTGEGIPDLAYKSRTGTAMLVAEIKPANLLPTGVIFAELQLLNYINKGNSADNASLRESLGVKFFSPLLPITYALPPSIRIADGRHFWLAWCFPGVIGYKLKTPKRKKKQEEKKAKKKPKSKKAKPGLPKKKALKDLGKKLGKGLGKKLGKKAIPGEAYVELAMIAVVIAAGGKPSFGGQGMSTEEALLEIVKHGPAPNVKLSEQLEQLLEGNPDLQERLTKLAEKKGSNEEAAKEIMKLLEKHKESLDKETLEGLIQISETSKAPAVNPTSEQFKQWLEAGKPGKAAEHGKGGAATTKGSQGGKGVGGTAEAAKGGKGTTTVTSAHKKLLEQVRADKDLKRLYDRLIMQSGVIEVNEKFLRAYVELKPLMKRHPKTVDEILVSLNPSELTDPLAQIIEPLKKLLLEAEKQLDADWKEKTGSANKLATSVQDLETVTEINYANIQNHVQSPGKAITEIYTKPPPKLTFPVILEITGDDAKLTYRFFLNLVRSPTQSPLTREGYKWVARYKFEPPTGVIRTTEGDRPIRFIGGGIFDMEIGYELPIKPSK